MAEATGTRGQQGIYFDCPALPVAPSHKTGPRRCRGQWLGMLGQRDPNRGLAPDTQKPASMHKSS